MNNNTTNLKNRVGEVFQSNNNGAFRVEEYLNSKQVKVVFIDTNSVVIVQQASVVTGNIKDPKLPRLTYDWGINDLVYSDLSVKDKKMYSVWNDMIRRAKCTKFKIKYPTYLNAGVSDQWKYFSSFRDWVLNIQPNKNWHTKGMNLDKDILGYGGKMYEPNTAVFIDNGLNKFITDSLKIRGLYCIGVTFHKRDRKFYANCNDPFNNESRHVGYFSTEIEAHKAWQAKKHEYACQLADLQDDPRVADALRQRYAPDKDWTNK